MSGKRESPATALSSRRRTRESGVFVRDTPGVRSLERGLQLLRAFRPGVNSLANAEFAERTGFPRATVSRLAATLVAAGFLDYDVETGLYRPGAPFLGLGLAVRNGSAILQAALPIMREVSEGHRINVGLAVADGSDIVYLDSVRRSQLSIFRHIISGTRLPMAETALGHAWLAGLSRHQRQQAFTMLQQRYAGDWPRIRRDLNTALSAIQREGYCAVEHRSTIKAVAAPLVVSGYPMHAINISYRAPAESAAHAQPHAFNGRSRATNPAARGQAGVQQREYGKLLAQIVERIRGALV